MNDFRTRLVEEYNELENKRVALGAFVGGNPTFHDLSPEQKGLLKIQQDVMNAYARILRQRLEALNV